MGQLLLVSVDILVLCSMWWRDRDKGLFALTAAISCKRERS